MRAVAEPVDFEHEVCWSMGVQTWSASMALSWSEGRCSPYQPRYLR